jgi:hypothetical protein
MKRRLNLDGEAYGDLRARRMEITGRVELLQVLNDPPPYWLVIIRSFEPKRDTGQGIDPQKANVWRFLSLEEARIKFLELKALPWCRQDEEKIRVRRQKATERLLKVSTPFKKKEKPKEA